MGLPPDASPVRLRLPLGGGVAFGPGKAALLDLIAETGSIAAAGRRLGMSYRRAWSLVRETNAAFAEPVVVPARGGPEGGGATLTPLGREVLAHFRALEALLTGPGAPHLRAILDRLADMSDRK
jgi:molybdate transport system regulatory protein